MQHTYEYYNVKFEKNYFDVKNKEELKKMIKVDLYQIIQTLDREYDKER